eukprot:TRINITY_DN5934_c0_g1_i1.p1 TRINITY_DN5934_c0_g1~~TRINITY_DN5934_c0_g1_i1.p1  ORF type:complete len:102 (-),score=20.32 TRINITY_DN5934_c0_g1_i1:201-506(-)
MGKKTKATQKQTETEGWFANFIGDLTKASGEVSTSAMMVLFVSLFLVLMIGVGTLVLSGMDLIYIIGFVTIILGFGGSIIWFSFEHELNKQEKQHKKKHIQ